MAGNKKYAGFIGRFQPWHKGHQRVLAQMVAEGFRPIVFIGSCNADRDTDANPFSFEERVSIIKRACKELRDSEGNPVAPIFVPVFDYPRMDHEKPYYQGEQKIVPLNSRWFAQFKTFLKENNIRPEDFTLFYSSKKEDRKNYSFQEPSLFPGMDERRIFRNEDLSCAFEFLGCQRKEIAVSQENARTIRQSFNENADLLVAGTKEIIDEIVAEENRKNAAYDDVSASAIQGNPLAVLAHERRVLHNHLFKHAQDPGFRKNVLLVGADGSLGMPVIEALLQRGHDLVLASPRPQELEKRMQEVIGRFPDRKIRHIGIDMRKPETGDPAYWEKMYRDNNIAAVLNMAGIIEEKPDSCLTFEAINYRPVPAMAEACVSAGIDRYIYFSTLTAGHPDAEQNARQAKAMLSYAGSKRKAELALEKYSDRLNWFSLRPVTAYDPKTGNWGRDMTFPDLANLPTVPVWGGGDQLMQPLYTGDLAKVAALVESNQKGGKILSIVGPEQIRVKDILRTVRSLRGDFRSVNVPLDRALRLADRYPIGAINRSFMNVMKNLEITPAAPVDPRPWKNAVGATQGLTRISDLYNKAASAQPGKPPVLKYARMIARQPDEFYALLEDSGATGELMASVRSVMEVLAQSGESAPFSPRQQRRQAVILRRVIETLGKK